MKGVSKDILGLIFLELPIQSVLALSETARWLHARAADNHLWRALVKRDFGWEVTENCRQVYKEEYEYAGKYAGSRAFEAVYGAFGANELHLFPCLARRTNPFLCADFLIHAVQRDKSNWVETLLLHGVGYTSRNIRALDYAIRMMHTECIWVLVHYNAISSVHDAISATLRLIYEGALDAETATVLFENWVDPGMMVGPDDDRTWLFFALDIPTFDLLVTFGVDVHHIDDKGLTCRDVAVDRQLFKLAAHIQEKYLSNKKAKFTRCCCTLSWPCWPRRRRAWRSPR